MIIGSQEVTDVNLKKKLKKTFYLGKPISADEIISKLRGYKAVSFDIFDTLLKRNVEEPTDIFEIVQKECKIKNFKTRRIEAEKRTRLNSKHKEVTLDEIYCNLEGLSNLDRHKCMDIELETERAVLTLNQDLYKVYQWCLNEQILVFITSDMYLPEPFIKNVLNANGICNYIKIYLSSTYRKAKIDGSLFKVLLEENGLNPSQIIHIGDSKEGDFSQPRKLGISTIKIPRYYMRKKYTYSFPGKLKCNSLNLFLNNTEPFGINDYQKFGYECFGPFLWGYVRWIYKAVNEKEIKKVYFFSRDGLIIKKAFDLCFANTDIKTFYLEVSRRSLRVPILWMDCSFNTILNMLSPSKLISLETIFDGVGLEIDDYENLIAKHGLTKTSIFDRLSIADNPNLQSLYKEIVPDIEQNSRREYKLLKKYIVQNDLCAKFAIVDIGWSGGMQRYLEQTLSELKIEHDISGYYTGIASYYKRNTEILPNMNINGYLFDFKNNVNSIDKRSCFVGLFELLFLEQEGSVKKYESMEGLIRAIRYDYEYMEDGKPMDEYIKIKMVQESALKFVKTISTNQFLSGFDYSADDVFEIIRQIGANPSADAVRLFADFNFYDEGETHKLAEPQSLFFYLMHPYEFKKDFLRSRWKTGFMKRMLKIKLPYETMYNFMLRYK